MHWKINTCWDCKQVTNEINPLSTLLCYMFLTILKCVHLHFVLINLRLHVSSNCKKMLYQNYTQTLIQYGQRLFHVLQIVLKARGVFLHSKALYEIHNMISTRKTKRDSENVSLKNHVCSLGSFTYILDRHQKSVS